MKTIKVNKIIGYKRWVAVEVVDGSEEHKELIRWNRAMNYVNKQDKKEIEAQNAIAENEISAEQMNDETGFEFVDIDEPSPEEWYVQNEIKNILAEAISALPENQREIILLHFYQGISLREIAKEKGKRLFTIQKSYQSALDKLRENSILKKIFKNFS